MLGVLASILGNGEVIKKGMDLIDDVHSSDEEMERVKAQAKIDTMKAYAPFKVAQRWLALMFTATFLLSFALVLVMTLMGETNIPDVKQVIDDFYLGEAMLCILAFYFGGGMLEGVVGKVKEKKMNKDILRQQLAEDEGCKYEVYLDHLGLPTCGIGHLITESDEENGKPVGETVTQERVQKLLRLGYCRYR